MSCSRASLMPSLYMPSPRLQVLVLTQIPESTRPLLRQIAVCRSQLLEGRSLGWCGENLEHSLSCLQSALYCHQYLFSCSLCSSSLLLIIHKPLTHLFSPPLIILRYSIPCYLKTLASHFN